MFIRSTESTIHFGRPFSLSQVDETQPAGSYRLITEEERLEGPSCDVFQRMRTLLHLPAIALADRACEVVDVDPIELTAALVIDALQGLGGHAEAPVVTPTVRHGVWWPGSRA